MKNKRTKGKGFIRRKLGDLTGYLIALLCVAVVVCFSYALGYFRIINLHSLRFWLEESSSSVEKPETEFADLTISIYVQNPESGEYELSETQYKSVDPTVAFEYEPASKLYYTVDYWRSTVRVDEPTDDTELTVYYDCETCTVTFVGGGGSSLISGEEKQVLRKGQTPIVPQYYKKGYEIAGYEPQLKKTYQDTEYVVVWQEKESTVTLNLTYGASLESDDFKKDPYNENNYSALFKAVTDEDLLLPIPEYEGFDFIGWYDNAEGLGAPYTHIEQGTEGNVVLYSLFNATIYEMRFIMDEEYAEDYQFTSILAPAGTKVNAPKINPEKQIPGYGLNWYKDEEYTQLYSFTVIPTENTILYGVWEEDVGKGIFQSLLADKSIDSEEEMVLFLEAISFFYNLSWVDEMEVTFATKEEIALNMSNYIAKANYSITSTIAYSTTLKTVAGEQKLYISANVPINWMNEEGSLSTEYNKKTPYGYLVNNFSSREDYGDFYIDSLPLVPKSSNGDLFISTSNQLIYLVEHGYQPQFKENSKAEIVYGKAREVLNSIIGEDFTDYQKVIAIFDYLALNVQYDHAATLLTKDVWGKYDAFTLEGVFNKNKAVCDGISKAFSLMCNMEGIPCVRVRGNEHAWCKVKINNRWTVVDPTHGNTQIDNSNKSVLAHEQLMMTDAFKQELGYTSLDCVNIVADYTVNYYEHAYYTYKGNEYNLIVSNKDELKRLLQYCIAKGDLEETMIDFCYIGENFASDFGYAYYALKDDLSEYSYIKTNVAQGEVVKIMFKGTEA